MVIRVPNDTDLNQAIKNFKPLPHVVTVEKDDIHSIGYQAKKTKTVNQLFSKNLVAICDSIFTDTPLHIAQIFTKL